MSASFISFKSCDFLTTINICSTILTTNKVGSDHGTCTTAINHIDAIVEAEEVQSSSCSCGHTTLEDRNYCINIMSFQSNHLYTILLTAMNVNVTAVKFTSHSTYRKAQPENMLIAATMDGDYGRNISMLHHTSFNRQSYSV